MTPLARLSAAIDIIEASEKGRRPAILELQEWQRKNRYAGSKDRAAIYNLLQDCYRMRGSTLAILGAESARMLVLGTAIRTERFTPQELVDGCGVQKYAPDALTEDEKAQLATLENTTAWDSLTPWQANDMQEWVWGKLVANFAEDANTEAQAFLEPAPVDIRVNLLRSTLEKCEKQFSGEAKRTDISQYGLRFISQSQDKSPPQPTNAPAFKRGDFEIQDEGSQIVSQLIYAQPGDKILDYCAGAGGKSLAMAAQMQNKGQIFAYDAYEKRLSESVERIKRAGAHNIQLKRPKPGSLDDLIGKMDRVVVDAPCTGSGTWRRRPDLKWRLTQNALQDRIKEQSDILESAKAYPKIGGFLIYITCSIFMDENEEQIAQFLDSNPNYELVSCQEVWEEKFSHSPYQPWSSDGYSITLTPASTKTDGFFFAVMERRD